jgi:hypothetical protein
VRFQIVEESDITPPETRRETSANPHHEQFRIHHAPPGAQGDAAVPGGLPPTNVRLSPQFIGRRSTYSSPRMTYACGRPIAMFAPASSTNTKR